MIITSNLSGNIEILENEINVVAFQDTRQSNEFVRNFLNYLNSKEDGDDLFTEFIDDEIEVINPKKINSIILNCGSLDIVNDRYLKEAVLKHFEEQIFADTELVEAYAKIEMNVNQLLSGLKIEHPLYKVELDEHTFKVKQFLKLFNTDIHANNENMTAVESRIAYVDLMKDSKKENVLILLFPEANIGLSEMRKFNQLLKEYGITTIMITNHSTFVKCNEHVNLMKLNKEKFDFGAFEEEVKLFVGDKNIDEELLRELAFMEFSGESKLVNNIHEGFLQE